MISLTRVKQATSEFIKVLRYGKKDVRTAPQYLPFGIDSKPVNEMIALYADTDDRGELAIIGYLIKSENTNPGELALYSTDSAGIEKFRIYLKNDGTCEIGGNTDNFVRFSLLDSNLQELVNNIQTELSKIQTGLAGVGGVYTPGVLSLNIDDAKIDEILTS